MAIKKRKMSGKVRVPLTIKIPSRHSTGAGPELNVMDDAMLEQVEHLAATLNIEMIADFFGISERTFHNIRKRQPEVDAAYKRGRAHSVQRIGNSLIQRALRGDSKAQEFYLATQGHWVKKTAQDLTSSDGSMSPVESITRTIVDPKKRK